MIETLEAILHDAHYELIRVLHWISELDPQTSFVAGMVFFYFLHKIFMRAVLWGVVATIGAGSLIGGTLLLPWLEGALPTAENPNIESPNFYNEIIDQHYENQSDELYDAYEPEFDDPYESEQ